VKLLRFGRFFSGWYEFKSIKSNNG